jgi:nucleoid DNA-binding protein
MATAKKSAPAKAATKTVKAAAKTTKASVAKPATAVKKAAPKTAAAKPVVAVKPIKETFNKTSLAAHLAATSGMDVKAVRSVMAALESTMLAAVHKKGAGEFTLPGIVRVAVQQVPAKKARKGIDPFTKEERVFKAKPASVKLKARFFKKLKDAAL